MAFILPSIRTAVLDITNALYYTHGTGQTVTYSHTNTAYTQALVTASFQFRSVTPTNCTVRYIGRSSAEWGLVYFYALENLKAGSTLQMVMASSGGTGINIYGCNNIDFE